jgi:hypothetical protein
VKTLVLNFSAKNVIILLILLVIVGSAAYLIYEETKIVPIDLLEESMDKTFGAKSYSFGVETTLIVDGKERPLSNIKGKKDAQNNYHITGTMLRQGVEVYQIKDTTYLRENNSDKWMVMEKNNIMTMQQFTTEINPLSNFSFAVPETVDLIGKEKVGDRKCIVLECIPHVENQFLNLHWKNFRYKLWIDKGKKVITKAEVTAENKENSKSLLDLKVTLGDFNKVDTISAPKVDS